MNADWKSKYEQDVGQASRLSLILKGDRLEALSYAIMLEVAKRLECAGFSGAVGRAERLEWWIFPVRTKSGAEVTATSRRSVAKAEVQTLREFRSVVAFVRKPPSEK